MLKTSMPGPQNHVLVEGRLRRSGSLVRGGLLLVGLALASIGGTGCKVREDDVRQWALVNGRGTRAGPEKLKAVLAHDKYDTALRVLAADSLIRMAPRDGRRVGIEIVIDTLSTMRPETAAQIVAGLVPTLVAELTKPPPVAQAGQPLPPDPSFPFKDATFALLTSDKAALVPTDELKQQLHTALIQWVEADFERRLDNKLQGYGMEQLLRYLKGPGVAGLPKLMTRDANRLEQMAGLVGELGDPPTKEAAAKALVSVGGFVLSKAWLDLRRPELERRNTASGNKVEGKQLEQQLGEWQTEEAQRLFNAMRRVGARPVIDFLLDVAARSGEPEKRRAAALQTLAGKLDKTGDKDIDRLISIASSDAPDLVLDQALVRVGEFPREKAAEKLYGVFAKTTKWKVRHEIGAIVLKMSTMKHAEDFMARLPAGDAKGFSLMEPLRYGLSLGELKEGSPKDLAKKYLAAGTPAQRTTAAGYFFGHGTKDDLALLTPLETDKSAVPTCDTDEQCKWSCTVDKAGGKPGETESKEVKTFGDFVKFCVEPEVLRRAAPPAKPK
jgi:hypothetical protein